MEHRFEVWHADVLFPGQCICELSYLAEGLAHWFQNINLLPCWCRVFSFKDLAFSCSPSASFSVETHIWLAFQWWGSEEVGKVQPGQRTFLSLFYTCRKRHSQFYYICQLQIQHRARWHFSLMTKKCMSMKCFHSLTVDNYWQETFMMIIRFD